MPFIKVATLADVPPGKAKQVKVQGRVVGLFNVEGTIHAIDDLCPHRNAPLSAGEIIGHEVVCPLHMAAFDLRTGEHLCPPAVKGVAVYRVQVTGQDIEVEMP